MVSPAIQARNREQLRLAVGDNCDAVRQGVATSAGSTTTIVDTRFIGDGDDEHNGKWIVFTSGDNDGRIRQVSDFVSSSGTFTVRATNTALATTASGDTFELWDSRYPPARIHRFLNQALVELTGRVWDREESLALHADGKTRRFDIPSQFAMLDGVFFRRSAASQVVHAADAVWSETTQAALSQSADTTDYKEGSASLRVAVTSAAAVNSPITAALSSTLNLSKFTHLEFWAKSNVTRVSGDWEIHLHSTTVNPGGGASLEELAVPALTARTWTYARVALANPESDTAINSIGLNPGTTDAADTTSVVWLDDIKVTAQPEDVWERLSSHLWRIDPQERDLLLTEGGRVEAGYSLLKLRGGDRPALLSEAETSGGETATTEVSDRYLIARTSQLALLAASGGPGSTDPDYLRQLASHWGDEATKAWRALPVLADVRQVTG